MDRTPGLAYSFLCGGSQWQRKERSPAARPRESAMRMEAILTRHGRSLCDQPRVLARPFLAPGQEPAWQARLAFAQLTYAFADHDGQPLLLADFRGDGLQRDGLLLTSTALFVKPLFEAPLHIALDDMCYAEHDAAGCALVVNGHLLTYADATLAPAMATLADCLERYVTGRRSEGDSTRLPLPWEQTPRTAA